jgi:hypothetical protein
MEAEPDVVEMEAEGFRRRRRDGARRCRDRKPEADVVEMESGPEAGEAEQANALAEGAETADEEEPAEALDQEDEPTEEPGADTVVSA